MKNISIIVLFSAFLFASAPCEAAEVQAVQVEVLYMNHGPMRPTIRNLQTLFAEQGEYVVQRWFDFESAEGDAFKEEKGVTAHVPCMIWVDGANSATVDGKTVTFIGFPTGAGPAFFQGNWTLDDLKKAVDASAKAKNPETR